jgi:hypothetical protein
MIGKGFTSFLDRTAVIALAALSAITAITAFSLTGLAQTQSTPTPSPTQSPSPKPKISPAKILPPPKPYATAYGRPSASPSPSVQLPPDLLPDPQHVPVPTPPPPATNDLLPENKPAPTPVVPEPTQRDLIPSTPTPTPGASPSGSAPAAAEVTPTPKKLAEQVLKEKMRFRQLESKAERDPHAIELWNTADKQYTMEYRRQWQRLYYVYVCDIMRKLDPSLKELIDSWEETHLSAQSAHNMKPTVPREELRGPAESQTR